MEVSVIPCPKCSQLNTTRRTTCKVCGTNLKQDFSEWREKMKCLKPDCGYLNEKDAIYCSGCGSELRKQEIENKIPRSNKAVEYENPHYQQPHQIKPKTSALWVIIIIVFILAGGGYYIVDNKYSKKPVEMTPSEKIEMDKINNWMDRQVKLYRPRSAAEKSPKKICWRTGCTNYEYVGTKEFHDKNGEGACRKHFYEMENWSDERYLIEKVEAVVK